MASADWIATLRQQYGVLHLVKGRPGAAGSPWSDAPHKTACGFVCSAPPPGADDDSGGVDVRRGLALTRSPYLADCPDCQAAIFADLRAACQKGAGSVVH